MIEQILAYCGPYALTAIFLLEGCVVAYGDELE